jgi:hypothetical protein
MKKKNDMEMFLYEEYVEAIKKADEAELQYLIAKRDAVKIGAAYRAYISTKPKFIKVEE